MDYRYYKLIGDEKILRPFSELVFGLNGINNYKIIEHFHKPEIIFTDDVSKVQIRDMIYGWQIIVFDKDFMESMEAVGVILSICKDQKDGRYSEFYADIIKKIESFPLDPKYIINKQYNNVKNTICLSYKWSYTSGSVGFVKQLIIARLNGSIRKEDIPNVDCSLSYEYDGEMKKYIEILNLIP